MNDLSKYFLLMTYDTILVKIKTTVKCANILEQIRFTMFFTMSCVSFSILIQKANQWLQQHTEVRVKTCESIEVKEKSTAQGTVDTEKATYWESGEYSTYYVRCLRYI